MSWSIRFTNSTSWDGAVRMHRRTRRGAFKTFGACCDGFRVVVTRSVARLPHYQFRFSIEYLCTFCDAQTDLKSTGHWGQRPP
jgi:hypothetical protein